MPCSSLGSAHLLEAGMKHSGTFDRSPGIQFLHWLLYFLALVTSLPILTSLLCVPARAVYWRRGTKAVHKQSQAETRVVSPNKHNQ